MNHTDKYKHYHDLPLEFEVRVDTIILPIGELLDLKPGSMINTSSRVGHPMDLVVGNVLVGQGEVTANSAKKSIRVINIHREA